MKKSLLRAQMVAMAAAAAAVVAALPMSAQAESQFVQGSGTLTATARLDFRVTIPQTLYLRVGTGTNQADNTAVDLIDFVVPAASVGNSTPIAAAAGSGDLGAGAVTARVQGNNGAITLSSSTAGALSNGAGDTISWSQIQAAVTPLTSPTALAFPGLVDGGSANVVIPATGKIVNRDARWTFSYANAAVVPPGTYGGINANNGRVTFTASMP